MLHKTSTVEKTVFSACLRARKDRESRFHHCGGPVKLVQACLSCRNVRESSFLHCGGLEKLMHACLSGRKNQESRFHQFVRHRGHAAIFEPDVAHRR